MNALRRAAAFAAVAFVACDSPSPVQPRGEGERVPIGVAIEGQARVDSASQYSFSGTADQPYLIFLESLQEGVHLWVYDSTHGFLTVDHSAVAGGPWLEQNPSNTFGGSAAAVYRLSVRATPPATTARFRFKVHAIDTRPERAAASFAFGDTVSGETIDPMYDLDWFHAHGAQGQEIVTIVEPWEPAGSGSVGLTVIDDSAHQLLGYVFADAGAANQLTTGRMRLAGSHDYRFAFGSVISNQYPRYRGPYRFWTYVIDRAPEHRAVAIPLNTEVGNEAIERAGDVDEFTFQANPGDAFMAFLQSARLLQAEMALPNGPPLAIAACQASDTGLFARVTNRLQAAQSGNYILRVSGTNPSQVADTARYRLFLYAIDRRPEHVPAVIPAGVAVLGEDIGLPGDIDEFTFSGVAGEQVDGFFQAQNGSPDDRLQLDVVDPAGVVLRSIQSTGTDTSLLQQVTGRFALPSTGTYRLRVTGYDGYCAPGYRGPYQLFLHRVNGRPETLPDTLAFGDSLSGESIDLPGDFDEFRVTVPDSSGANLAFELDAPGGLIVKLIDSTTGAVVATAGGGGRAATGRLSLAPGKYIVRVDASAEYDFSIVRGAYRLWFYRFGVGPETAADTFAVGDTVAGEAIEPWGDADRFHFYGMRGQHINLMAQGLSTPSNGGFQFFILPPPGVPGYEAYIGAETASGALSDNQTARIDLPGTGWYALDVSGTTGQFAERGSYRFVVQTIDPGPEHVSATLTAGDSVVSEPTDTPGDWDEFTLLGTPGQTMSVLFDGNVFTGLYLQVFDPATNDTLAWQPNQFRRIVGPFRIPASGQLKIAVDQPAGFTRFCYDATCGGAFSFVGPYRFHVLAVNPAPENVPAAIAVGDTVRGETISPVGDIDEFTTSGTPGEQLTLLSRLTTQSSIDSAIVVEVIDPATGASLVGGNAAAFGNTFFAVGTFTVPATGTFIVRAHAYGEWGYGVGQTAYEFFVKRGP